MPSQSAVYWDAGRNDLHGVAMPMIGIECDQTHIQLQSQDLRSPYMQICGRANVSPNSTTWYDGTQLVLASLSLSIESDTGYQDIADTECFTPAPRTRRPVEPKFIQFGTCSSLLQAPVTICPFAIRVPTTLFASGASGCAFTIRMSATFRCIQKMSSASPSDFTIHANPASVYVAARGSYPITPPYSP